MSRGRAPGPGRLWKRDAQWVLDFTDASGRRRRRTLGTDKRVAERRRQQIIAKRDMELDGLGAVEGQNMPVREVLDAYLADLKPRVTPLHYKNVSQRLEHVVGQLNGSRVRDLRPLDAVALRNQATAAGASNRTANLLLDRLRAMFRWAVQAGLIAESPIRHLPRLPESRDHQVYRRRALSEDEIARFLAASEADDERNGLEMDLAGMTRVPQTPLWLALLETGARWSELRQVKWGDVDLQARLLVLRAESTKSRKQRVIPLRQSLVECLQRLRAHHEGVIGRLPNVDNPVFLSPEGMPWRKPTTNAMRVFDRLLDRASIAKVDTQGQKLDIHALRHTFGTRLARAGVGLVQAQRLLGHSDPKLTAQVYTHLDVEDLRGAVEQLPEMGIPHAHIKEAQ